MSYLYQYFSVGLTLLAVFLYLYCNRSYLNICNATSRGNNDASTDVRNEEGNDAAGKGAVATV